MSDILPLLRNQQPVPEKLLGYWCIALREHIPVLTTQFMLETVMPVWKSIGKAVVRREELESHRDNHPEFCKWYYSVPEETEYAVIMLTSADDKRCVILLDRQDRRAEILNHIEHIVPPPMCDEIGEAVLWIGRLMLRKLFHFWNATPKPLDEAWLCTASAMCYLFYRLSSKMNRDSAGKALYTGGLSEFIKQLTSAVEPAKTPAS
jgi:hypothetical protein